MDKLLYVAGTGAAHIERLQTLHANNLANVATDGFRGDFAQARSVAVQGDGYSVRAFALAETPGVDLSPGVLHETGRELDIAVEGSGFFAVETPDGSEAYTRAGALHLDTLSQLRDSQGRAVLGIDGPLAIPQFESLSVGTDGVISIRPAGQGPETVVQVGTLKLVNPPPEQVVKRVDGLIALRDGAQAPAAIDVQVRSGYLEGSNVNAVGEMTAVLGMARQYEIAVRMMSLSEENDEAATRMLQIG